MSLTVSSQPIINGPTTLASRNVTHGPHCVEQQALHEQQHALHGCLHHYNEGDLPLKWYKITWAYLKRASVLKLELLSTKSSAGWALWRTSHLVISECTCHCHHLLRKLRQRKGNSFRPRKEILSHNSE